MTATPDFIRQQLEPPVPMSFPLGRRWYVAECFSKQEFVAEESIKAKGFSAYTPKSRHFRKSEYSTRRREKIERPLFPGYCFVAFDIEREEWRGALPLSVVRRRDEAIADGVRCLLSNNLIPVSVPRSTIERIIRAENAGAFDYTIPLSTFREGDDVEIADGPLRGMIAKIKSAKAKKRIRLLLNGMMIDMDAFNLVKVT